MPDRYRIILSKQIAADLEAIFAYIAKDSPQNASAFVGRIYDAIEGLKTFPHRTVIEEGTRKAIFPIRSLPVQPYIIYFRVIEEEKVVRILQVRHGARRRPRGFN